ncbi:MAG: (2Fe-2S)-binding protein [Candidatus Cloacimonetes bacterium]|nr:(2Fe-2S)-binding protein [Candidatus Cloacimonadota bacterium]
MTETTINNEQISLSEADLQTNLLTFLRDNLHLTGAKNGCGIGACGACTVLVDFRPVRSCVVKVESIVGKQVTTIEGLENSDGSLSPVQQAFVDCGAIQCGFCTPGMVLTAHALLLRNPEPTESDITKALRGNICRCTGYRQIISAVQQAATHYKKKESL